MAHVNPPALGGWGDFAAKVGVPGAVLLIVLFQLTPRIDRGIQIADRVDAQLSYIAAACGAQIAPPRDR